MGHDADNQKNCFFKAVSEENPESQVAPAFNKSSQMTEATQFSYDFREMQHDQ